MQKGGALEGAKERLEYLIAEGEKLIEDLSSYLEQFSSRWENKNEFGGIRYLIDESRNLISSVKNLLDDLKAIRKNPDGFDSFTGVKIRLGEMVDLPRNPIYVRSQILLSRTEGLWNRCKSVLRLLPISFSSEEGIDLTKEILTFTDLLIRRASSWTSSCLRWAREALPPESPLHLPLMEIMASLIEDYPEKLKEALKKRGP